MTNTQTIKKEYKKSLSVKSPRGGCLTDITWHSVLDYFPHSISPSANPVAHFRAQKGHQGLHETDNTMIFSCTRLPTRSFPLRGEKKIYSYGKPTHEAYVYVY